MKILLSMLVFLAVTFSIAAAASSLSLIGAALYSAASRTL